MKMRTKCFLILMLFSSVLFTAVAQDADSMIEKGFSTGDASLVGRNMADKVFCVIYPVRKSLVKDEAVKQLDAFFKESKPKGFSAIHDSRQENVRYIIGKIVTASGDFRIHLLFDTSKDNEEITQIRIESL